MVRGIEANILRNDDGFPMQVNLKKGPQKLTIDYPSDQNNFIIKGDEDLLPVLNQIYPFTATPKLSIPQPLAVQTVAGGKVILYEDFESLLKWKEVTATVAIDNTFAYSAGQSLKLTSGLGTIPYARRYFPVPNTKVLELEALWCIDDPAKCDDLGFWVLISNGQFTYTAQIQYVFSTHFWQYTDAATGAFTNIAGSYVPQQYAEKDGVAGAWHKIKFRFNWLNQLLSLQADDLIFDLNVPIYHTAGATTRFGAIDLVADAAAGQIINVWFDDIMLTEIT